MRRLRIHPVGLSPQPGSLRLAVLFGDGLFRFSAPAGGGRRPEHVPELAHPDRPVPAGGSDRGCARFVEGWWQLRSWSTATTEPGLSNHHLRVDDTT